MLEEGISSSSSGSSSRITLSCRTVRARRQASKCRSGAQYCARTFRGPLRTGRSSGWQLRGALATTFASTTSGPVVSAHLLGRGWSQERSRKQQWPPQCHERGIDRIRTRAMTRIQGRTGFGLQQRTIARSPQRRTKPERAQEQARKQAEPADRTGSGHRTTSEESKR
ncbi:hypothetical protein KFL_009310060 [Klebsormidium nitens]|uniref:Uncharacterized protein n=1 Tax=Klebsormidium nitens TaxID=105231 RepID=A0A1Y1IS97_KLENI|nr:hypothetical protein KFL_009310060 [Klebsormidium nitens]|eukprot:GAQ92141.1 hypothetical protein KFL_009310060 [Klebsormidium nitens]